MTTPKANPIPVNTQPETLAQFYAHYWNKLLSKMEKSQKAELLGNLSRKEILIRGKPVEYSDVRIFVRNIAEEAETNYEKAQIKKQTKDKPSNEVAGTSAETPNPS